MNGRHTACLAVLAVAAMAAFSSHSQAMDGLSISSSAFSYGGQIPPKYARTHDNVSPPLSINHTSLDERAVKSMVLIVDDPDAPVGLFTHWVVWNISPSIASVSEGEVPQGGVQGKNSHGDAHYDGPSPPNGKHRYFFHLYGLDTMLSLAEGSDRHALEAAMKGHVVAKAPDFYATFTTGQ